MPVPSGRVAYAKYTPQLTARVGVASLSLRCAVAGQLTLGIVMAVIGFIGTAMALGDQWLIPRTLKRAQLTAA